jgi:hypothetical protein
MGFFHNLFGGKASTPLSKQEISEYLTKASKHDLAGIVSCVVLEKYLTEKGLKQAAEGKKILKKHQAIFLGCSSGSDIGSVIIKIFDKWPDVSMNT